MARAFLLMVCLLTVALAGCASSPDDSDAASSEPIVHTSPQDFGNATDDAGREHLHDYWGQAREMVVFEDEDAGSWIWGGDTFPVLTFRPGDGEVFPQGARWINVSLEWTADAPDNNHEDPRLWVKTAAESEPYEVGPVESGVQLGFEINENQSDLPHQQLSAWVFELRVARPDGPVDLLFDGEGTVAVSAARGHPLSLFPGHPDRWNGADGLPLMAPRSESPTFVTSGPYGTLCSGCPAFRMTMDSGTVVPLEASEVEVTIEYSDTPMTIDFGYHPADTRTVEWIDPDEASEDVEIYRIPVTGLMGDGPYALQSLWEFFMAPSEDTMEQYSGSYTMSARVLR